MTFSDFQLHPSLLQALAEIGFEKPTPIQAQAIPAVLSGRDVLGSAQTGTGKTAAFLLPSLHRMLQDPKKGMQILVLEPTRELALQVEEQAKLFGQHTPLRAACVYGGVAMGPQEKALAEGFEVIAATPGRLLDHMRQGNVKAEGLTVLVLDEVDRMLDMGFLPDVRSILNRLPKQRQTLFFSATVPPEIQHLCDTMLHEPVRVAITPDRKTAEGISQRIYPVAEHLKPVLLNRLLTDEEVTSALVFTKTKQGADKVCSVVERHSSGAGQVERIHGDRSQKERSLALTAFKEGRVKFLVATDIAARGIDVDGISHVINYDLPDSPDDYVHRIGRTARAGATGNAWSLVSSRDSLLLSAIEQHLHTKLEKCMLENFNYDETMGPQHEVRQGHDGIKHFDEKRERAFSSSRPAASFPSASSGMSSGIPILKDSDERATIIVKRAGAVEMPESSNFGGGRDAGRGGRGDRGPRGGGDRGSRGPRGGGRPERAPRPEFSDSRPASAPGESPQGNSRREREDARREAVAATQAMSATDVLRRAGSQKAAVESSAFELRPQKREEAAPEFEAPLAPSAGAPAPASARYDGPQREGADGPRRKRRRGGRGRGPRVEGDQPRQAMSSDRNNQGGRPQQGNNQNRGQQGRGQGGRNDRNDRGGRNQGPRDGQPAKSSSGSLWSKIKGVFGISSKPKRGDFGDKW